MNCVYTLRHAQKYIEELRKFVKWMKYCLKYVLTSNYVIVYVDLRILIIVNPVTGAHYGRKKFNVVIVVEFVAAFVVIPKALDIYKNSM